ncbi:hypothetical protein [Bradyrhizobium genosp. A]|uniref:hypothetical protein n=1 Tax=Bradyrhizobium genosp. A TaxID=83626 RepID=UPI003CF368F2
MTTETTVGPSLSSDEAKFFETGGESGIPADSSGADAGGGDTAPAGGAAPDAGTDAPGAGDGKGADAASKTVPLTALHEERTRRKELDKQLRDAQQQIAEFRGRFSVIEKLNGGQQQTEQQAGDPTPEDDIFGAVNAIKQKLEATEAEKKAATEHTTFVNNYKADAQKFTATTPDYMAAYNHLLSSRAAELQAIGYEGEELGRALQADEIAIAQMAMSKGKSPAEMLYALAKQRGYSKPAETPPKGQEAPTGAEKLEAIERGQAANKSLSNTGGNSGDQDMTAERLMGMPMDEFEAWCDKNPAKARRIMGG